MTQQELACSYVRFMRYIYPRTWRFRVWWEWHMTRRKWRKPTKHLPGANV